MSKIVYDFSVEDEEVKHQMVDMLQLNYKVDYSNELHPNMERLDIECANGLKKYLEKYIKVSDLFGFGGKARVASLNIPAISEDRVHLKYEEKVRLLEARASKLQLELYSLKKKSLWSIFKERHLKWL